MPKLRKCLPLLFFLVPVALLAQNNIVTGSITASGTDCSTTNACVVATLPPGSGSVSFSVAGAYSGTLQFEMSVDGTQANKAAINCTPPSSTTPATSTTGTGTWTCAVPAMKIFQIRSSSYSSGTAVINISISNATSASKSGGGSSGLSGMTAGQVPIAATATTVTSSKALQGTDTNILTSGTVSGTGASLCTDAQGGATTSGCPAGVTGSGTTGFFAAWTSASAIGNGACDNGITQAGVITCTGQNGFVLGGSASSQYILASGSKSLNLQAGTGQALNVGDLNQLQIIMGTQGVAIGAGAPIKHVYSATATLDFGSLATIGCEDLTMTVTGAVDGDVVTIGTPAAAYATATSTFSGFVSSSDTVTVRYCALVSGNPPSSTFRATVIQY